MRLTVIQLALGSLLLVSILIGPGDTSAQTQTLPPKLRSEAVGNQTDVVMAQPLYSIDRSGGGLTLPDGSVIRTVWPAAMEVTTITDNPKWANQPVRPRCEPAVYSLARVRPDGKELWAKSYIFKGKVTNVCYAEYFGFNVLSALNETVAPQFYRLPFKEKFIIEKPRSSTQIEVNSETGEIAGVTPKNLRVIDAYELKALKERISKVIEDELPPPSTKKGKMNEQVHKTEFYSRLEKSLFPINMRRVADSQKSHR